MYQYRIRPFGSESFILEEHYFDYENFGSDHKGFYRNALDYDRMFPTKESAERYLVKIVALKAKVRAHEASPTTFYDSAGQPIDTP